MGRPKKVVPADKLLMIQELAARGVSEKSIAAACGVHDNQVFSRIKREQPEVQEALDRGRAVEHDKLVGVLFDAATKDGNIVAAMFLLKSRHGYKEGEAMQGQGGVTVNITLPGAMSPDEYAKRVIDGTDVIKLPK